jgi:hypothetical protein
MKRTATSRLTRNQGKKMARQSVGMIIFSIATIIIFFFVLMPRIIDIFFRFLGTGDLTFKEEDTIPPQVPVVLPLPESVSDSALLIEGYGEAKTKIIVVNNGEKVDELVVDDDGAFKYEVNLIDGENKLAFYGVDDAENESTTKEVMVTLDTEAPTLELENLEDGQEILSKENQSYTIKGKTEPNSKLNINERSVYVDSEGNFKTSYYLQEGDNELKFIVEDRAGNQSERTIIVKFRY